MIFLIFVIFSLYAKRSTIVVHYTYIWLKYCNPMSMTIPKTISQWKTIDNSYPAQLLYFRLMAQSLLGQKLHGPMPFLIQHKERCIYSGFHNTKPLIKVLSFKRKNFGQL